MIIIICESPKNSKDNTPLTKENVKAEVIGEVKKLIKLLGGEIDKTLSEDKSKIRNLINIILIDPLYQYFSGCTD